MQVIGIGYVKCSYIFWWMCPLSQLTHFLFFFSQKNINTAQQILFNAHIGKRGDGEWLPTLRKTCCTESERSAGLRRPLYHMLWCEDSTLSFNIKIKVEKVAKPITLNQIWSFSSSLQNDAFHFQFMVWYMVSMSVLSLIPNNKTAVHLVVIFHVASFFFSVHVFCLLVSQMWD